MAGLREQKKQAVRQRLYEAAINAFARDGYEQASVDAICADAAVAKGTFFNHFPSKADLLAAWYATQLQHSLAVESARPDVDPWHGPALAMVELVQRQPVLWAAKMRLAGSNPALARIEAAGDAALRAHYRRLLEASAGSAVSAERGAELIVAAITGSCREWCIAELAGAAPEPLLPMLRRRLSDLRRLLQT